MALSLLPCLPLQQASLPESAPWRFHGGAQAQEGSPQAAGHVPTWFTSTPSTQVASPLGVIHLYVAPTRGEACDSGLGEHRAAALPAPNSRRLSPADPSAPAGAAGAITAHVRLAGHQLRFHPPLQWLRHRFRAKLPRRAGDLVVVAAAHQLLEHLTFPGRQPCRASIDFSPGWCGAASPPAGPSM